MTRLIMNEPKSLIAILPLLTSLGFVASASAREALSEESCELSCPKGFSCAVGPVACPAIFCEDPADCPPCEGPGPLFCAPDACESDVDCAEGALCAERLTLECPPPLDPAPPGYAAGTGAPTVYQCTSSTVNLCTPLWQLPCDLDSDCGSGFFCQAQEQQNCDGPVAPADPGAGQYPGQSPPVTCTSTVVGACVQIDTLCSVDADCPLNMDCADNGTICSLTDDGQTECVRQQPEKVCRPQVTAGVAANGSASAAEGSPASATGSLVDDVVVGTVGAQGGCSVSDQRSPAGGLALFTTLGMAALFAIRRKENTLPPSARP